MNKAKNKSIVKVRNVKKTFKIPREASSGIKQKLVNQFKGVKGYRDFTPLDDVSLDIKKGEFVGIIGRNGSGKSTLLKIIANIYHPTKGSVDVRGSLVPFIELGVGFNPELSGRENVFLNGALLGFSHNDVLDMYDDIVGFAELEDFMEERLKNYSSGMQVRLAFSIAIRARSDILLLDEVLAVGDANFQRKCLDYFNQLKKHKQTVIFISHDMNAVTEFCDRVIILDKGKIIFDGNPDKAALQYSALNFSNDTAVNTDDNHTVDNKNTPIEITKLQLCDTSGSPISFMKPHQEFVIDIELKANKDIKSLLCGVQVQNSLGDAVLSINNKDQQNQFTNIKKDETLSYQIRSKNIFHDGTYTLACTLKSSDRVEIYDEVKQASKFNTSGWNIGSGVHIDYTSRLERRS